MLLGPAQGYRFLAHVQMEVATDQVARFLCTFELLALPYCVTDRAQERHCDLPRRCGLQDLAFVSASVAENKNRRLRVDKYVAGAARLVQFETSEATDIDVRSLPELIT
jgi:hypothetical protein